MKISPLPCLAALGLLGSSLLAQGVTPDVLSRIRDVFGAIDTNSDGKVDLTEATRAKIATRDFSGQDVDKSATLDASEFLVYYRQLLVTAGRKVPAELDTEITRVETERRRVLEAEKAAEAKRMAEAKAEELRLAAARREQAQAEATTGEVGTPAPVVDAGTDERAATAEESQALIERMVAAGALTTEEGRDMLRGLADQSAVAGDTKALEGIRGAVLRAQPRIQTLVQNGNLTEAEARSLSNGFNARATAAATALTAAATAGAERAPKQPDAARALLSRHSNAGTLSSEDAAAMATALQDPAQFAGNPAKLGEIRDAVNRARPRLGALVQEGKLSADEARLLSETFQARGQAAGEGLAGAGRGVAEPVRGGAERAPAEDAPAGRGTANGAVNARDAQRLLGRLVSDGSIEPEEGRELMLALADDGKGTDAQLTSVRNALNKARPRIATLVQDGKLTADEGRGLSTLFNRRGKAVAQAIAARKASADERGTLDESAAVGEEPGRRAQAYVRRLVNEGRVSASEGRVMYQAMTDPATIATDATQLQGVRAALEQARPRIGELVRQGHLTVDEGRELSGVFDARATAAASALQAIEDGAKKRPQEAGAGRTPAARPGSDGAREANDTRRTGGDAKRPAGDAKRPAGDAKRPAGDAKRPAGDAKRPAGDAKRPAGDAKRPAGDAKRPAGDAKRPAGDAKRPAGNAKRPAGARQKQGGAGRGDQDSQ